jgi:hypothetical protein
MSKAPVGHMLNEDCRSVRGREGGEWMTTESLDDVRAMLAQDFEDKAEWRDTKADEYPEDGRNERAAKGLRELAAYVRALPDDDPRLQAIDSALHTGDFDLTTPDMVLTSYGFGPGSHHGLPDSDTFLVSMLKSGLARLRLSLSTKRIRTVSCAS